MQFKRHVSTRGEPRRAGLFGKGLVGAVLVVEPFVLANSVMVFVLQQAAIEEFTAAGLHPSLHDRVHTWHPNPGEHGLDAGLGEGFVCEGWELPIPVSGEIARPAARILRVHHQWRAP
ncbi:hypothetical protein ACIHFD_36480 [Nonomuraea sp. NPDC051941]|uniref:hypothetical protein n=1 Tax=Nonomuraea sp. NPDC051941 TaxID=3364373 RepID=UPI0037C58B54